MGVGYVLFNCGDQLPPVTIHYFIILFKFTAVCYMFCVLLVHVLAYIRSCCKA